MRRELTVRPLPFLTVSVRLRGRAVLRRRHRSGGVVELGAPEWSCHCRRVFPDADAWLAHSRTRYGRRLVARSLASLSAA